MRRLPATFRLTDEELKTLEGWLRQGKTEQRMVERARIILLANEGRTNQQIAEELGTRTARVSKWRQRFFADRLLGLGDAARSGKPALYDQTTEKQVLALLDQPPPKGYAQWNGNRLAEVLPGVSSHQIWRILRRHDICLQRRRSWCISTDPEFGAKAADVVGLYLNPPQNALVLSVDEKPSIQALERAQGYLRLPDGKAVNGFSHGYKRHGTTTLFAALEITTGLVKTAHYQRRRRRELLDGPRQVALVAQQDAEAHVHQSIAAGHRQCLPQLRVNSVNPGKVRTNMRLQAYPGEDRSTLPEASSILPTYLYLLGPDSRGVTGRSFDCQPG